MIKKLLIAAAGLAICAPAFAGAPMVASKTVVEPAPILYGVGPYVALQGGANFYQDYGDTRRWEIDGEDLAIGSNEEIGWIAGVKAGYVFGTGVVRPTLEADLFYNQFDADLEIRYNGDRIAGATSEIRSGAFLANLLFRFDLGQFQPYLGAGIGGYYAQNDDIEVTVNGDEYSLGDGDNNSSWAWQLVAGADYYLSERMSIFAEYKFLNYEEIDASFVDNSRVSQQIGALGLRFHF